MCFRLLFRGEGILVSPEAVARDGVYEEGGAYDRLSRRDKLFSELGKK